MARKTFNTQHWYVCGHCPTKQFVMAKNKQQADNKIHGLGWEPRPAECAKCKQERNQREPYDFVCEKCNAIEVVEAKNIEAAVMVLLQSGWTAHSTPLDWANPENAFRCLNCNKSDRERLERHGEKV